MRPIDGPTGNWFCTLSFVLFVVAGVSDWLDGYLARRLNQVSDYGKLMDALSDKVLMVGIFICLYGFGLYPSWALFPILLILSREFLITGLRLVAAGKGMVLAAEKSGKYKTAFQIISAGAVLLSASLGNDFGFFESDLVTVLHEIGVWLFVLATILTASSGSLYVVKYWDLFIGKES
jgi:CDP-diacylglycerol--glycerol-3-phosphate 3-phosphatidyltransferase